MTVVTHPAESKNLFVKFILGWFYARVDAGISVSSRTRSKTETSAPQEDMLYRELASPCALPSIYDTPGIKSEYSTPFSLTTTPDNRVLDLIEDSSSGANPGVNTEGRLGPGYGMGSIETSGSVV